MLPHHKPPATKPRLALLLASTAAAVTCLCACASHGPVAPAPPTPAHAPDAPQQHDELLDHLAGDWSATRSMRGTETPFQAEARWVLGDRWLSLHMLPPSQPPSPGRLPYEAIVFLGYDADAKEYICYWHDTFGAAYGAAGRGKRSGDTIEFCFDDGSGSRIWNTFTYDRAGNTWTSLIQNQAKGKDRTFFAQEMYRRR